VQGLRILLNTKENAQLPERLYMHVSTVTDIYVSLRKRVFEQPFFSVKQIIRRRPN